MIDDEPFDFSNCFQRVDLAGDVALGALWRQLGQLDKPVHDIELGESPSDLGTRSLDDRFLLLLDRLGKIFTSNQATAEYAFQFRAESFASPVARTAGARIAL